MIACQVAADETDEMSQSLIIRIITVILVNFLAEMD